MKVWIYSIAGGVGGGLITFCLLAFTGLLPLKPKSQALPALNFAQEMPFYPGVLTQNLKDAPGDFVEASEMVMPAVVHIKARRVQPAQQRQRSRSFFDELFGDDWFFGMPHQDRRPREGAGSGVILTGDGYIVTNNHVIEWADEIEVTLIDRRRYKATVIGTDPSTDIALLKIDAAGLRPIILGDSDETRVGEWVLAVGNPFNLTSTVTAGIISAKARNIQILEGRSSIESFLQTDAAVNPGNSGGALVNTRGELVGINTAIASRTGSFAGYSFAIPVNIVAKIVEDLMEFGTPQRGFIGVNFYDLDAELAADMGLPITEGIYIESLAPQGPAIKAGVLPGDVVVGVGNRTVRGAPEFQEAIGRLRPGDTALLKINRRGEQIEIPVILMQSSAGR